MGFLNIAHGLFERNCGQRIFLKKNPKESSKSNSFKNTKNVAI